VPLSLLDYSKLYPLPKTLDETVEALEHFEDAWLRTQARANASCAAAGPSHESRSSHTDGRHTQPYSFPRKRHDTNQAGSHTQYQGWPMQFCSWCTMNNHSLQKCTRLRAFMSQFVTPWGNHPGPNWPPFIPPMPPPPPGFAGRNAAM
jgi:hypothetical protein